ncbi:ribonuclease H-like protein [Cylindrobasidium torrendii FP15055 ss-10]|uniref:ribonuclease H n=1 Tax=Cylindrobasidium torrendii FP15055 ss-10 TaxID=1314674 RepID=A0A0D7BP21_9AGAR|nr:ribonuclease H-like protein [Cylindrobasidium torrendii FP15055 ss-10]
MMLHGGHLAQESAAPKAAPVDKLGPRPIQDFVGEVRYEVSGLPTSHQPRIDMPILHSKEPKTHSTDWRPGPLVHSVARFHPPTPNAHPTSLFAPETNIIHPGARYVRRSNWREVLIYTDGACSNNGQNNPQAGWAAVYHPSIPNANIQSRLELRGVDGKPYPQTSNRAELRAVLGALEYRHWPGEGFLHIVIATDSEYVVLGMTERLEKWRRTGWKTASGQPVKNRDLWEAIAKKAEDFGKWGTQTQFWLIPRDWNVADALAKEAAAKTEVSGEYAQIHGFLV